MILNSPTISGSLTVTGNIITSGSITLSGSVASASYAATASFVALAQSASNAVSAQTASFANAFTVASTLTAQTLVVQTITSSVDFVTGSTRFGSIAANTHIFTGSMYVTGAFYVATGSVGIGTVSPSQLFEVVGGEIKAGRVDSSNEGGQVSFGRSTDNATAWYIDAYGNTASPQLRFVNVSNAVVAMTITGSNVGIGSSPSANARFRVLYDETDPTYSSKIQAVFGPADYQDSDATNIWGGGTSETQFTVGNTARPAMLSLGGNVNTGEGMGAINFFRSSNTDGYRSRVQIWTGVNTGGTANQHGGFLVFNTAADGATNPQERVRITSTGCFKATNDATYDSLGGPAHEFNQSVADWTFVSRNKNASPYGIFISYTGASPNSNGNEFLFCRDSALVTRLFIRSNGGIANYQANDSNLSDIRTKKDISPLESYWDKFKAIEIVKFKYKDQTHDDFNIGVIAQQVESIAPEFIDIDGFGETPEDGTPLKTVYTSDLHHATIKVLQEAMAKIEELKAQNDDLQSQINELKAQ
jgi:hypothetical protein